MINTLCLQSNGTFYLSGTELNVNYLKYLNFFKKGNQDHLNQD